MLRHGAPRNRLKTSISATADPQVPPARKVRSGVSPPRSPTARRRHAFRATTLPQAIRAAPLLAFSQAPRPALGAAESAVGATAAPDRGAKRSPRYSWRSADRTILPCRLARGIPAGRRRCRTAPTINCSRPKLEAHQNNAAFTQKH